MEYMTDMYLVDKDQQEPLRTIDIGRHISLVLSRILRSEIYNT